MTRPSEVLQSTRALIGRSRLRFALRPLLLPWFVLESALTSFELFLIDASLCVRDVLSTELKFDLVAWLFLGALAALILF